MKTVEPYKSNHSLAPAPSWQVTPLDGRAFDRLMATGRTANGNARVRKVVDKAVLAFRCYLPGHEEAVYCDDRGNRRWVQARCFYILVTSNRGVLGAELSPYARGGGYYWKVVRTSSECDLLFVKLDPEQLTSWLSHRSPAELNALGQILGQLRHQTRNPRLAAAAGSVQA